MLAEEADEFMPTKVKSNVTSRGKQEDPSATVRSERHKPNRNTDTIEGIARGREVTDAVYPLVSSSEERARQGRR